SYSCYKFSMKEFMTKKEPQLKIIAKVEKNCSEGSFLFSKKVIRPLYAKELITCLPANVSTERKDIVEYFRKQLSGLPSLLMEGFNVMDLNV
ncbi:hypothetical protein HAX54_048148, partial [Datura stramonium]|nr:hypothetical protein [Datura stramonium]